jgi:hypothetical protein
MTRKDDTRILVALARGYTVSYHWAGTERPRFGYVTVKHGERWRNIDKSALWRVCDAGLVDSAWSNRCCDYGDWSEPCALTAAGRAAAADLTMSDDALFAAPKVSSPEQLQMARDKSLAKDIIRVLTFNGDRIRDRHVRFASGESLVEPHWRRIQYEITDGVWCLIDPHLEAFVDVDGKESMRITEAGIAATARTKRQR